jgi:UDP-N-acetylglucosamine 2-epimerase
VGSGTHGVETARVLEAFETHLLGQVKRPAGVVVVGDVNSTMAGTLAAVKQQIPVAHIEAGVRSFDRTMPEEINRVVTDAVADLRLVSERSGLGNLEREGIGPAGLLTDSGGVQEETSYLRIPCLTLRPNTERPVTVSDGTNTVVGDDLSRARSMVEDILVGRYTTGGDIDDWDGRAAVRIADVLEDAWK